jgi:hypothetical protein
MLIFPWFPTLPDGAGRVVEKPMSHRWMTLLHPPPLCQGTTRDQWFLWLRRSCTVSVTRGTTSHGEAEMAKVSDYGIFDFGYAK